MNKKTFLQITLTVTVSFIVVLTAVALVFRVPLFQLTDRLITGHYVPDEKYFKPLFIKGVPVNFLYIIFVFLITSLLTAMEFKRKRSLDRGMFMKILLSCTASFLIINAGLQTVGSVTYFLSSGPRFYHDGLHKKYLHLYGWMYSYPEHCRRVLDWRGFKGKKAKLITDLDLSKDPGMVFTRIMSYFLYPTDLRGIRPGQTDILFLYRKEDALKHLDQFEPDFVPLHIFDETSLIAVRKDAVR